MSSNVRETRLQVMLTSDELRAVDDWRFKQRMPSRAAAIRQLINIGMRAATAGSADPELQSQDFGLLTENAFVLNDDGAATPSTRSTRRK